MINKSIKKGLLNQLPKVDNKTGWPWNSEQAPEAYDSLEHWPKFSIITPCFNHGQYLEETIRSVLLQNYPNLEFIIIDGGSTDDSVEIIKKYEPWLTYWISEKDDGQSNAINKGIKLIKGELTNWVNSDDFLMEGALVHIASYFIKHVDVDLIYGNSDIIYPGIKTDHYEAEIFEPIDFISRISVHQPSTFWRTKLFNEVGILDENLHFCMDYDFWARVFFNYKTSKLNKTLSGFRRYPESKSSNFEDQNNIYNDYRTVVSRFLSSIAPEFIPILKKAGVYRNNQEVRYRITKELSQNTKNQMLETYLMVCALQEYNKSNIKETNHLIRYCLKKSTYKQALILLLKNNLRIRRFFHPYRKSEYN